MCDDSIIQEVNICGSRVILHTSYGAEGVKGREREGRESESERKDRDRGREREGE